MHFALVFFRCGSFGSSIIKSFDIYFYRDTMRRFNAHFFAILSLLHVCAVVSYIRIGKERKLFSSFVLWPAMVVVVRRKLRIGRNGSRRNPIKFYRVSVVVGRAATQKLRPPTDDNSMHCAAPPSTAHEDD